MPRLRLRVNHKGRFGFSVKWTATPEHSTGLSQLGVTARDVNNVITLLDLVNVVALRPAGRGGWWR